MNIEDFFDFSSKFVSTTFHAYAVGLRSGNDFGDIGDGLRLVTGYYDTISFPVTFKHEYGKKFHDVLDTGRASLFLISDRMKSVLEKNALSGWQCFPISLLDKKGSEIEGYQGLSVTGRCGPIDVSKSEIIQKRLVPNGPLCTYYKGFYVGLDEWDGSDFFLPKYSYGTIISAKAADVIRSNKLTNIQLKTLADIEINEGTADLIRSKQ
jgi:hypothetical protein